MPNPIRVLFWLLVLPLSPAFGQKKLAVSAMLSPLYVNTTYNRLYLFPDSDGQLVEPVYLNGHRGSAGYLAGLTVHYAYRQGWSVATGIAYRAVTIGQSRPQGDGTTTIRSRAVRIPLSVNYRPSPKKLSPYYSLGLFVDIPMTSRVVVTRSGQPTQTLRLPADPGPVFNAMLGAGASYRLSSRFALTAQPTFTYKLGRLGGSLTDNRQKTYELGLLTQLIYMF